MKGICRLLIALMIWAPYQVASAGMLATTQASAGAERAALAAGLQAHGVDALIAKERVAAMTDQEVQSIAGEIANAPAGGVYTEGLLFIIIASLIIWAWYKHRNPY